ncbi:MAG: EAL domain-containing protein [Rhodanobacter sp.]|nr:EAL domain-containing protein [Rhodanobacter sp.]
MTQFDDIPIKLLLINDSAEDAEQFISVLRNGGIAVRPARASNEEELEAALEQQIPDLIVVDLACQGMTMSQVRVAVARSGRDIALIVVGHTLSEEAIVAAYRDGTPMLLRNSTDHTLLVIKREFGALMLRRNVRRLEANLRESERRCDTLLDSSRDPIAFIHEGMHVRANKAYLEIFGCEDFEELEGISLLDMIAAQDLDKFKALLKQLYKNEKLPQCIDLRAKRSDGSTFDVTMEFTTASYESEPCQQITLRTQMPDVSIEKDRVTDLFNRRHMVTAIEQSVALAAKEGKNDQALLLLEPDDFRSVLDTIGFGNADVLLKDLAAAVRAHVGEADIVGRIADFTFGVLTTGRSAEATHQLTQTLRETFSKRIFETGKQSISLTISVGGTLIGEKDTNASDVMNLAMSALRTAQALGGNRTQLNDPATEDKVAQTNERHWLAQIDAALANDRFVPYYQSIISLCGSEGDYFEVLLHMAGPSGDIPPNQFLPIAERHGKMPEIDRWVIAHTIRTAAKSERAGQRTLFFVKLAPQSLEDQTLLPWIAQQLKAANLSGNSLVFEMHESHVVTNLKPAHAFAKGIEQLHCEFALEQFGSGLNSFQLLTHIPARYLKIDRHFMLDLPRNKESQEHIKELCEKARQANKITIAESVEDAASMSLLFGFGVDFVQGNFLQMPEKSLNRAEAV